MSKVSEVITKLQQLQKQYGDLDIYASTQDGSVYNVKADDISFDGSGFFIE